MAQWQKTCRDWPPAGTTSGSTKPTKKQPNNPPGGGGANDYRPGMMDFAGGYYESGNVTHTGNEAMVVVSFNRASFTGGGRECLQSVTGNNGWIRASLWLYSSDYVNSDLRGRLVAISEDNSGVNVAMLVSKKVAVDAADHVAFYSFNGAGSATFWMDTKNTDDTGNGSRVAPTVATLDSGLGKITVGASLSGGNRYAGLAGFMGSDDQALTNPKDFMKNNYPLRMDEAAWTPFGGKPISWNRTATMERGAGQVSSFVKTGTINYISGNSYNYPRMQFNGTTSRYAQSSVSLSGNKVTLVASFVTSPNVNNQTIAYLQDATGYTRLNMYINNSGSGAPNVIVVICKDASNTTLCFLRGTLDVTDGEEHEIFFEFDADAGTASLLANLVDIDDTGAGSRVVTTGTLTTAVNAGFGGNTGGASLFAGALGYIGYDNTGGHNPEDYYKPTGFDPVERTESGWEYWNRFGTMESNDGTAGNMTNTAVTGPS